MEKYVERAIELGAIDAKIIATKSIVTAAWVRMKCQFGCDDYNTSYCCPPNSPAPEQTRMVLDCYDNALFVHCQKDIAPTPMVATLEREIFLDGYYKALALGCGPCTLCKKCAPNGCIHSHQARPSMEACGIDVFATARNNGFPIEVLKDKSCLENCYGLVLIE